VSRSGPGEAPSGNWFGSRIIEGSGPRGSRTIELRHRGSSQTFRGDRFLTEFAIPTFFFHVTLAYAILRHEGVPLQKGDFLGA
jgi:hypothetical protein